MGCITLYSKIIPSKMLKWISSTIFTFAVT